MFSRRHPYLFFMLMISLISSVSMIILSFTFTSAIKPSKYSSLADLSAEKVGVIEINGVISSAKETIENIKIFREDKAIKAIVIRINSPGGAVGPSQEIYREIIKTTQIKRVIASMGSIAASGGYYAASAADGIMANAGTITGSIGVIMGYTSFKAILEKIGLTPIVIKSGEYKDIGSPARDMTDKEKEILQEFVDAIHRQFIKDTAQARNMKLDVMESLADGRIYTGEQAQKIGLIDRLGNLEDAVEWAGRMGGIKGKIQAVYPQEKKFAFLKYIKESSMSEIANYFFNDNIKVDFLYKPENSLHK